MELSEVNCFENNHNTASIKKYLQKQDKQILIDLVLILFNEAKKVDELASSSNSLSFTNDEVNKLVSLNKELIKQFIVKKNHESKINKNTVVSTISPITKLDIKHEFAKTRHLAFKFLYLGKNYAGLVTQNSTDNTIENKILSAFEKVKLIKDFDSCNYTRCGRTDIGVSAFGNVFDLDVRDTDMDHIKVVNRLLPSDIRLYGVAEVDHAFDSRFSCLYREYKYFFLKKSRNIDLIKQCCRKLIGTHSFYNFCKVDRSKTDEDGNLSINFTRRIFEMGVHKFSDSIDEFNEGYYDVYYVKIKGSAFLWHQIRCFMSIIFAISEGKEDLGLIDILLKEQTIHYNYHIADDSPLILSDCQYEGIDFKPLDDDSGSFLQLSSLYENTLIELNMQRYLLNEFCLVKRLKTKTWNEMIKEVSVTHPLLQRNVNYTPLLKRKRDLNK